MKINKNKIREHILDMVYKANSGHIGGSFSIVELVCHLYSKYPGLIEDNGDKLILSKGHAVPVLYSVLYELGLIDSLNSFREINSDLQGHPVHTKLKYLHATTGSLGQGLSISIGHALALKMKKSNNKVFCILGDGEMQEGQIWESIMLAPKYKLNNLICFLDRNGSQNDGYVEDILPLGNLKDKIKLFGWDVYEIDGHDDSIQEIPFESNNGNPTFVILNTIKGKGVSFMQSEEWHAKAPNKEEYLQAKKELNYESN
jgi:transketolase